MDGREAAREAERGADEGLDDAQMTQFMFANRGVSSRVCGQRGRCRARPQQCSPVGDARPASREGDEENETQMSNSRHCTAAGASAAVR